MYVSVHIRHTYVAFNLCVYCRLCSVCKHCAAVNIDVYLHPLQSIEEESTHLFPFMLPGAQGSAAQVYCRVKQLMTAVTVRGNEREQKTKAMVDGLCKISRSVD